MPTKTKKARVAVPSPRPVKQLAAVPGGKKVIAPLTAAQEPAVGSDHRLTLTLCILLVLATFAVYYRATKNPFVNYDDWGYVTENNHVQQGLTKDTLRWALTATDEDNWHPLTWISHALDCQLFGLNPAGHHLTSVTLHLLTTALLFLMLAKVTGARWRSLLVALLFALHPINVESVAWVAERKNVLSMFFFALTLGAYGWYAKKPNAWRFFLVAVVFALGLTAKPMIVTLPCVLLLLDFWPLQRVLRWTNPATVFPVPQFSFEKLVLEKLPLLLLSLASSAATVVAQRGAIRPTESYPVPIRVANSAYAYVEYLIKTFWPFRLASFYPYQGPHLSILQIVGCITALIAISVWVWRNRSRAYLPVGWFWFLGTLVPVIGLVQVGDQAMADRYAYLPLVGIFAMVVWGVADWLKSVKVSPNMGMAVSGLILVGLAVLTWRQIGTWSSSYNLWTHALAVTENNYMAEDYVGTAILVKGYEEKGVRYSDEALAHFQNAARINPKDAISHLNIGADYQEHGKPEEAIEQYRQVLSVTNDARLLVKVYIDLGAAYQQKGDLAIARRFYQEALKMDPHSRVAFEDMGTLGMDQRIQQLASDATAKPSATAYLQLGQLQQARGRLSDARASYEAALSLDRNSSAVRAALKGLDQQGAR